MKQNGESRDEGAVIRSRVEALRGLMLEKGISMVVIPTEDYHGSEYVDAHFCTRKYITGFSGSAGTAVISREEACLWTDGRYFIQAAAELRGTGIILQKMEEEGVPTIWEYVERHLEEGGCLAFDGRVVSAVDGEKYAKIVEKKQARLHTSEDLVGQLWKDRPSFPVHPAWILEERYAGRSAKEKLADVRAEMKKAGANLHLLSDLCDIAWILNIRGNDIPHVPVVMSYLLMGENWCTWYADMGVLGEEVQAYLKEQQVQVRPYEEVYQTLGDLPPYNRILLDKKSVNYSLLNSILDEYQIVDQVNPEQRMKAIKNPVELENIRKAHVQDAAAVIHFIRWVKEHVGKETITELSASEYLAGCRRCQPGFLDLSFETIAAYGPNAAMMHYQPGEKSNAELKPEGLLLVDSGGHYREGSTDITRTIVLGSLTDEEKQMYTSVCIGNLALANARFLHGCSGLNLDILCRAPLWKQGIDYKCGTGHGNGYLLNVHEGPNGFRWRMRKDSATVLEEGMVTTDEPGVYMEGRYGIRIENELVCVKDSKNEYGQFMRFENITYVPIDLDAILPEMMSKEDRENLNNYHRMVYETMAPCLDEEDRLWLKENTREI